MQYFLTIGTETHLLVPNTAVEGEYHYPDKFGPVAQGAAISVEHDLQAFDTTRKEGVNNINTFALTVHNDTAEKVDAYITKESILQ